MAAKAGKKMTVVRMKVVLDRYGETKVDMNDQSLIGIMPTYDEK